MKKKLLFLLSLLAAMTIGVASATACDNGKPNSSASNTESGTESDTGVKETYTIKFVDEDGTELSSATYEEGATVEAPAAPTKADADGYSYTFAGWDKEVTAATADVTYTATYTKTAIEYTITFMDGETVVATIPFTVETTEIQAPEVPVRPGYENGAWSAYDLTKLENQQYVTERSEFYIDEQIRHALLLFEKQWSEKDLELQLDMEEIFYETDEGMLLQVWINLLSNAVKFSPCGGRLSVSLKKQKEQIVAEISDEGPGIPKEDRERIFDKFYQSDRSHTTEGNGLGLALVKQIATLLGAELSFESEEGKGTVFRFSLPEKMSDLAELVDPQSGAVIKNS